MDSEGPVGLAPRSRQATVAREFVGANRFGAIAGAIGGAVGVCFGVAAVVIALIPSSALWMSGIVCISSYHLAYISSHYSYQPGQSVGFQCVNGESAYDVSDLAVFGLHSVLAAFVLCVGVVGISQTRARLRRS